MKAITKLRKDYRVKILPFVIKKYESDGVKNVSARIRAFNNYIEENLRSGQITKEEATKIIIPGTY